MSDTADPPLLMVGLPVGAWMESGALSAVVVHSPESRPVRGPTAVPQSVPEVPSPPGQDDSDASSGTDCAASEASCLMFGKLCTLSGTMKPLPEQARTAIRTRRLQIGLTQPKAADASGVNITTWNGIEKGRSAGAPHSRAAMCRVLGWTVDSIDRLEAGQLPVEADAQATLPAISSDEQLSDEFVRAIRRITARLESLEHLVHQLAADALGRRAG